MQPGPDWSRRSLVALAAAAAAALDLGGTVARRLGTAAPAVPVAAAPAAADPAVGGVRASLIDVSEEPWNVVADATTDWSAVLAAAARSVAASGGGVVRLPAGTVLAHDLPCLSRVAWEGAGMGVTIVQLVPGSTGDVFVTDGFGALTGGDRRGGPVDWAIRRLTIDGSRDTSPHGGNGISAFGYEFFLSEVLVRRCHGDGVHLEFRDRPDDAYGDTSMESSIERVKVMDCDGNGFRVIGLHDSTFSGCIAIRNGFQGLANFHVSGSHTHFIGCHAWGAAAYGWRIEGESYLLDCQSEGATAVGISIEGDGVQIVGGRCFWPEVGGGTVSTGIRVGTPERRAGDLQIRGMVVNRGSAADPHDFAVGLDVTGAGTGCVFDLSVQQTSGVAVLGAFPADALVQLRVETGGGWSTVRQ